MWQARNTRVRIRFILLRFLPLAVALGAAVTLTPAAQALAPPRHPSAPVSAPHIGRIGAVQGNHRVARPDIGGRRADNTSYGSFDSSNWDGYVATNNSGTNTTSFNSVSAQWIVPAVNCDSAQPEAQWGAFWVGLDGFYNPDVEQDGISAFCNGGSGQALYSAWWDMAPDFPVTVFSGISAGDTIQASVTYNTSTSQFDFALTDVTSGQSLTEDTACQSDQNGCVRSSAEVISEDAGSGDDVDGVNFEPNYGSLTFSDVSITDSNGNTGSLADSNWVANTETQASSQGVTKQTTSALSADGTSFSTFFQHELGSPVPLLYEVLNSSPTTTQIQFEIEVINQTSSPIPLSDITIRYFFNQDSSVPMVFSCDFAVVGCSNATGTFGTLDPTDPSRTYLQIGFGSGAGSVEPGDNSGVVEVRAHRTDFASIQQISTISFNANDTSLTYNPDIQVYDNGNQVYGISEQS